MNFKNHQVLPTVKHKDYRNSFKFMNLTLLHAYLADSYFSHIQSTYDTSGQQVNGSPYTHKKRGSVCHNRWAGHRPTFDLSPLRPHST